MTISSHQFAAKIPTNNVISTAWCKPPANFLAGPSHSRASVLATSPAVTAASAVGIWKRPQMCFDVHWWWHTAVTINCEIINTELPAVLSLIENKSSSVYQLTTQHVIQPMTLNLAREWRDTDITKPSNHRITTWWPHAVVTSSCITSYIYILYIYIHVFLSEKRTSCTGYWMAPVRLRFRDDV